MSKLTLSVDQAVIARAKRYAKQRGVSISQMVETYLTSVSEPPVTTEVPPVLRLVQGILKRADPREHKSHLTRKYR